MNKGRKTRIHTVALLVILLVCILFSTATATGKTKNGQSFSLQDEAWTWVYVPSTLPDYVRASEWVHQATIYSSSGSGKDEMAERIAIEFVSGDDGLKNAVKYRERVEPSYWLGDHEEKDYRIMELYIDNAELKAPGRAVFHITYESKSYLLERDCTLRVLSWEEHPLFTPSEGPYVLNTTIGKTIREDDLARMAGTFYYDQIISEIKEGDERIENRAGFDDHVSFRDPDRKLEYDMDYSGYVPVGLYQALDYGSWEGYFILNTGNIACEAEITLNALPYAISGNTTVKPGTTAEYTVADAEEDSGRTFIWSLEGDGIILDATNATVIVPEDIPEGTPFTLTATPSDGGIPVTFKGFAGSGLLSGKSFTLQEGADGFSFPLIDGFENEGGEIRARSESTDSGAANQVVMDFMLYNQLPEFVENGELAREYYSGFNLSGIDVEEDVSYEKDGHPVRLIVCNVNTEEGGHFSLGFLLLARNNRILRGRLFSIPQNGTDWESLPKVTMDDMKILADQVVYDVSKASVTVEDAAITITAKDGGTTVTGGKKLQLSAAFANPDRVNKKAKNDTLTWTVIDPATGEVPEGITIDKKGVLSADKKLAEVKEVEVRAESPIFHVSSGYRVSAVPAVSKITTDPAEIFLYTGTNTPVTVKTILEPDTVPLKGITWKAAKEGTVEIVPGDDGTAEIRPLAAGKVNISVTEPGGRKATLKANVADPVTGIELTVIGKQIPGGTVTVKETLEPKSAGNKAVEWSLEVGEDIATISKGKVKIAKTAPAGTVITVTCTATGAPEPVVKTVQIEVEGK